MKFNSYNNFGGGYYTTLQQLQKGGQAVVGLFSVTESKRGGQRYSLIGGDSYGK